MANINIGKYWTRNQGMPKKTLKAYVSRARALEQRQRVNYVDKITYVANFIRKKLESGVEFVKLVMERINEKMRLKSFVRTAGMVGLLSIGSACVENNYYMVPDNPADTSRVPNDTTTSPVDTIPSGPTFENPAYIESVCSESAATVCGLPGTPNGHRLYWFNEGNATCEYQARVFDGGIIEYGGGGQTWQSEPVIYCKDNADGTIFKRGGNPNLRFWDPNPGTERPFIRNAGPDTVDITPEQVCECNDDCLTVNRDIRIWGGHACLDEKLYPGSYENTDIENKRLRKIDYIENNRHYGFIIDEEGNQVFKPPGPVAIRPTYLIRTPGPIYSSPSTSELDPVPNFTIER